MSTTLERRQGWTLAAFAAPATIFMLFMFAIPLTQTLMQSISDPDLGTYTLAAYRKLASPLVLRIALRTARIVFQTTVVTTLLAYPVALYLSQLPKRKRATFTIFVLVPFWTSVLVKSFAFTVILGQSGLVNSALGAVGIGPLKLVFNDIGVTIGMCHYFIPFMVFPILSNLINQPPSLATAASIMGASRFRTFLSVTLPLSLPGVAAGALLVMTLSLGFYIVPALLGGRGDMMLANLVDFYARELVDWPMASALSVLLTLMAIAAAILLSLVRGGSSLVGGKA
jgi:putative spermidine/putrescine transport system permease protein